MPGTVLFTGAGVSKTYGLPLTSEIMPIIIDRLDSDDLFGHGNQSAERHHKLRKYFGELFPGLQQRSSDATGSTCPAITDALSLTDHLVSSETALARNIGVTELTELRLLIEQAIVQTLSPSDASASETKERNRLVELFKTWARRVEAPFSLVSTNYDTISDFALLDNARDLKVIDDVDFGMSWRSVSRGEMNHRPKTPSVSILKLHGSLNWLHCPACDCVYVNRKYNIDRLGFRDEVTDGNTCHCEYAPLRPVIVAPSFARQDRNSNLFAIWQAALEAMRNADCWILAGYSLPSEDYTIRALLQRAYYARVRENLAITVVQPNSSEATQSRYKMLFPDSEFLSCGFAAFLAEQAA